MKKSLKIVSRKSALALWQAEYVKNKLQTLYPTLEISIVGIQTEGDTLLNSSLTKLGGKGLFVKALEECLLNHEADIAVHSLKDMPAVLPSSLTLAAILKREDPRDAFVSIQYDSLESLPKNAVIGTSSLRRQSQVYSLRKDIQTTLLRGNVDTRVTKLEKGNFDAIILAVAGLKRLGLQHHIRKIFSPESLLPAAGQGALAIECRTADIVTQTLIQPLHHLPTAHCVLAERTMNAKLGGGCQLPIGALAILKNVNTLQLRGLVSSPNGQQRLKVSVVGKPKEALAMGNNAADMLFKMGAQNIIEACFKES